MWTKMSSPPWEGRMNPWPWDLEKFLHIPLNTGPDLARTVLQRNRRRRNWSWMFLHVCSPYSTLSYSRWVCASAFGRQWAGQLSRLQRLPLPLPNAAAFPQKGEGELQWGARGGKRQRGVRRRGGIRVWHLDCYRLSGFQFPPGANRVEEKGGLHLLHGEKFWME